MARPRLTRAMVLEARMRMPDGAGGFTEDWQAQGQLWAELVPRSGRDAEEGDVALARASYRIAVRAAPAGAPSRPEAGMRLRMGLRVFAILAVVERGDDGRFLTCFAQEEVAT